MYSARMSRTNIYIDDELLRRAMSRYGLRTKRETVHFALERLVDGGPMSVQEQLETRGIGWDGDLDAMRANRFDDWAAQRGSDAPG